MKCIKIQFSTGDTLVKRVPDDVAEDAVKNGWHYVPRHVWKAAGRP